MERDRAIEVANLLTREGAAVTLMPSRDDDLLPEQWTWEVVVDMRTAEVSDLKSIATVLIDNDLRGNLQNDQITFN
jgi:hypothetical protein